VADGNDASQAVARRAGFTEVGRDRLAEHLGDGSFADLLRFDLLATEYQA
jgi:RimJ/RimL family protein N-acetyltransferase